MLDCMRCHPICFAAIALLLCGFGFAHADEPAGETLDVRAVIERSIPYIEREGAAWIEERKCLSCHQVPFMVWSLNAAQRKGIEVDADKLMSLNEWAHDWKNLVAIERRDDAEELPTLRKENDTVAELLLIQSQRDVANRQSELMSTYRTGLLAAQKEDGSWPPGGQLPSQKRPAREISEVTTMWAMLSILNTGEPDDQSVRQIAKATEWLGEDTHGESTESWGVRLLLERMLDRNDAADAVRAELLKRQHDDGGWGWLSSEESDAFGTGVAIYALSRDGLPATDPAIARGIKFLTTTQQKDGSWSVHGTKTKSRDKATATAIYWGTCWAVIGLLETLPASKL